MPHSVSPQSAGAKPLALGIAAALSLGVISALPGLAEAADIPLDPAPAPAPFIEDRVASTFSRFGPYIGARGGFAFAEDTDFRIAGPTTVTNQYEDWDLSGSVFAGWQTTLFSGLTGRVEAELGYSDFTVERHVAGGVGLAGSTGDTTALFGAVNAYVDAELGQWRPFAGIGLGIADVTFDQHGAAGPGIVMDDSDNAFLWQVSGGLGYDLTENLTLEGLVRYQSIMDVELTSTPASGSVGSSTDLSSTSAQVGLRYGF
ncbi:MAG: outer membrane beta-barrel protein [Pseudomonadota bacterium]